MPALYDNGNDTEEPGCAEVDPSESATDCPKHACPHMNSMTKNIVRRRKCSDDIEEAIYFKEILVRRHLWTHFWQSTKSGFGTLGVLCFAVYHLRTAKY